MSKYGDNPSTEDVVGRLRELHPVLEDAMVFITLLDDGMRAMLQHCVEAHDDCSVCVGGGKIFHIFHEDD